ncbi:DUF2169 domain-containing protein [Nannocystaceae bacterium ST9]
MARPEQPPPPPRLSAALAGVHREGAFIFGVVCKRTYRVVGGACSIDPEQVPLVEAPIYSADDGILEHDADVVLQREQCDVIVLGHAYAPGRRSFEIRVRAGELIRDLVAFGDRQLEPVGAGVRFTSPAGFEKLPLRWENAYGGVDMVTREVIGDPFAEAAEEERIPHDPRFGLYGYPRNPVGKGYLIEPSPEAIAACRLPNFEDPRQLLTPDTVVRWDFMRWPTAPIVAATGWLAHNYFPRIVQLGMPPAPYNDAELQPEHFFEVAAGIVEPKTVAHMTTMRDRIDPSAVQQSALGMRIADLDPAAPVELVNLHPQYPSWRFRLPNEVPQLAYRLPGRDVERLRPRIRTLLLEPDLDRVTLVWAGEARVDLPITPEQFAAIQHGVIW